MNIADIQYSIETGSIEIYIAGCSPPHCDGCHNKELWDFHIGLPWRFWMNNIKENCDYMGEMVRHIWVLGGEPLDQDHDELVKFLTALREQAELPIWLFTRYEVLPEGIMNLCDYIKTGKYDPSSGPGRLEFGVQLATANQNIIMPMQIK